MPALMSLGPLNPPPPGEYTKARSRRVRKRRAKEYLRLEALSLRERSPKVFPPLELSEEADMGAARDQRGPGDSFGSEAPLVGPTPPHDTASSQVDQPPPPSSTQPQETWTVTLIAAELQPSMSRVAYGTDVFARLGRKHLWSPWRLTAPMKTLESTPRGLRTTRKSPLNGSSYPSCRRPPGLSGLQHLETSQLPAGDYLTRRRS